MASSVPLDERQTKNGTLLVLAENAAAHALFQPQGTRPGLPRISRSCRSCCGSRESRKGHVGTLHSKKSLAVTGGLKHTLEKVHDRVEKHHAGDGVAHWRNFARIGTNAPHGGTNSASWCCEYTRWSGVYVWTKSPPDAHRVPSWTSQDVHVGKA